MLLRLLAAIAVLGLGGLAVACTSLPEIPTDPVARCEALGGVAMLRPPTGDADGKPLPPELDHCLRDVHASEEDVRRARRAWHERTKGSQNSG